MKWQKVSVVFSASLFIFFSLIVDVSGSEKLTPERVAVSNLQYSRFQLCHETPLGYAISLAKLKPVAPPTPITDKNVTFLLYTRNNPKIPEIIYAYDSKAAIKSKKIDFTKDIIFFANGYLETYKSGAAKFTTILLPRLDVNIIIADWDSYAFGNANIMSNLTVPRLGSIFGEFFKKIVRAGANPKKMTLFGFSSGSQAIGIGARQVRPKVARIIAYSPDGNCFNYLPANQKITKNDADFVVIVHCSNGYLETTVDNVGGVTFYINGGILQPYCSFLKISVLMNICSHLSCLPFLYHSLQQSKPYVGVRCNSYADYLHNKCNCEETAPLIYDLPSNTRPGLYFVETGSSTKKLCK